MLPPLLMLSVRHFVLPEEHVAIAVVVEGRRAAAAELCSVSPSAESSLSRSYCMHGKRVDDVCALLRIVLRAVPSLFRVCDQPWPFPLLFRACSSGAIDASVHTRAGGLVALVHFLCRCIFRHAVPGERSRIDSPDVGGSEEAGLLLLRSLPT